MSRVLGPLIEAWDELRIHKVRILLALFGVTLAIAALTVATAIGQMTTAVSKAVMEQQAGRPASYHIEVWDNTGKQVDPGKVTQAYLDLASRYDIAYYSRLLNTGIRVRTTQGLVETQATVVDPGYADLKSTVVEQGRWFVPADSQRLSPPIIVNTAFWTMIGQPPISSHPTVTLAGNVPMTAEIVGLLPNRWEGEMPMMTMLYDSYSALSSSTSSSMWGYNPVPAFEVWIPPESASDFETVVQRDLKSALPGMEVNYYRMDWSGMDDWLRPMRMAVTGAALLLLLLGALGLLNLSLVTVRNRVREIGIRRSFGATAGRVFFAVMLESLVATALAGAAGVVIAAIITRQIPMDWLTQGGPPVPMPPFPMQAAGIGILAATVVGAIAGAIPALVATRVKVIDAIRY